jgi:hypothetical protein
MAERTERTWTETFKVEGGQLLDKVKQIVREGNVRRIVIKQGDRTIAEFPLTIGLVGAVFAPMLASVGAIAALVTDCSIVIERSESTSAASAGAGGSAGSEAGVGSAAGASADATPAVSVTVAHIPPAPPPPPAG